MQTNDSSILHAFGTLVVMHHSNLSSNHLTSEAFLHVLYMQPPSTALRRNAMLLQAALVLQAAP